ncbi:hypothetical protein V1525DRAFT_392049 [Lipomyces kononenkoae]|uniref:Uncharacterized protein n=1 Tax=Lipomyces kononenkoae TaxID=34357 RepID=A0ACC3SQD3_LIPKO
MPLSYLFEPIGQHTHNLERSDQLKRNTFVRKHLVAEAEKLCRPSDIIKSAAETRSLLGRQILKHIGGNYSEKSDILCKALETLKLWAKDGTPSATEQKAVKLAFPGLEAGEVILEHLLCKVHAMRTLKRRLNTTATKRCQRHLMNALLSKTTEIGCDNEIDLAMRAAPTDRDRDYIRKEWQERKKMWAAYARHHSAILLQIDTTNCVENFHSGKSLKHKYSIKGLVAHLIDIGERIMEDARRAAENFRTKHLNEAEHIPELRMFPLPTQKLIGEIHAMTQNGDEDIDLNDGNDVQCDCIFFRKYFLPCRHIFLANATSDILTEAQWNYFATNV